jgi:hypothetical protein
MTLSSPSSKFLLRHLPEIAISSALDCVSNYLNITSCGTCLSYSNTTWCESGAGFCMNFNSRLAEFDCKTHVCSSDMISASSNCTTDQFSLISVIVAFVLLIICPLCAIGACGYVIAVRCFANNKVAIDNGGIGVTTIGTDGNGRNQHVAYAVIPFSSLPIPAQAMIPGMEEENTSNPISSNGNNTVSSSPPGRSQRGAVGEVFRRIGSTGEVIIVNNEFIRAMDDRSSDSIYPSIVTTSDVKLIGSNETGSWIRPLSIATSSVNNERTSPTGSNANTPTNSRGRPTPPPAIAMPYRAPYITTTAAPASSIERGQEESNR